ncbi:MAG: tetratricopeptide repeat protein [Spirochaetaceae bacterium]|jgi:tetratricopeptide (TPR) repeat protein|nr:tetratricopeptide repeat protein [Spirochaetaceae bacterium]
MILAVFVFTACSSAPKRPAETSTQRNRVEIQLELARKETDRGNYEQALNFLAEAYRLAAGIDNPALLIRVELARGDVLSSLNRNGEAQTAWDAALSEADRAGETELAAIGRIHIARSRLLADPETAGEVLSLVQGEMVSLKSDILAIALGWTVIGLAEKNLGRWAQAEAALKKSLDIHDRERYLESAAYDWYLIASVRSVAGQYDAALEALEAALGFDRRAENTYGLGMDWLALGDVQAKAENPGAAENAYRRSAAIFRSMNMEAEAAMAEARLSSR